MFDKKRVINLALSQVGYQEKRSNASLDDFAANAGSGNYTKYARDLDAIKGFYNGPKQGYAYCDVFVDWCFVKAYGVVNAKFLLCQPDYSLGAGCFYSAQYFKQAGRFIGRENTPDTGDQIFFSYAAGEVSHTGLVVDVNASTVWTVEGNTSDGVFKRSYPRRDPRIYGYGRPRWDQSETAEPIVAEPEPKADNKYQSKQYDFTIHLLKKGDFGAEVRSMQILLNGNGFDCGIADGEFGNDTEKALISFQEDRGLTPDGEFGGDSFKALYY